MNEKIRSRTEGHDATNQKMETMRGRNDLRSMGRPCVLLRRADAKE